MSINLKKGENIDLTKSNPGVSKYRIGLGWDVPPTVGNSYDLDVSAFILGANQKMATDKHFVYFHNLKSPNDLVVHSGDNLTGVGDGDDETLTIDFSKATDEERIVFVVTIYDAEVKKQNFGQVTDAFIRIVNAETDEELMRYDLGEDYSVETAMVFGELYKKDGEFKFKAVGSGMTGGLQDFLNLYK